MINHSVILKNIRVAKGYSQTGVTTKLKLYKTALCKFERGQTKRNALIISKLIKFYALPEYVANILTKAEATPFEKNIIERYINKL
jgi:hypothetical protein